MGSVFSCSNPQRDSLNLRTTAVQKPSGGPRQQIWRIKRDPHIIPLTGLDIFNGETALATIHDKGFLTPVSIQFVRNHNWCPSISFKEHTLMVAGLVSQPKTFTMGELLARWDRSGITIPVTMACAGLRRKEFNLIKKTSGFDWGPATVLTATFTGIRLRDLLLECGVKRRSGLYVILEGADNGSVEKGAYNTSIPLGHVMDASNDVMLAWQSNGAWLSVDHGFPLRAIVPGFTGARWAKWLKSITISANPSTSYYYYTESRVLPSHVPSTAVAMNDGWFKDERFVVHNMPIQSVIAWPRHLDFLPSYSGQYLVTGMAWSGGGRWITKVELSFDGGVTWKRCKCHYPEQKWKTEQRTKNVSKKFWCWIFWEFSLNYSDLANANWIYVRAWDSANNTQPAKHVWNILGLGNNAVYKIMVHRVIDPKTQQRGIFFVHPTLAGFPGGWMGSSNINPLDEFYQKRVGQNATRKKEVQRAWFFYNGGIYDATAYLKEHPGGEEIIRRCIGTDVTKEFDSIHTENDKQILAAYYVRPASSNQLQR